MKDILCKYGTDSYVLHREDITITKDDSEMECKERSFRIGFVGGGRQGERIYSTKGKAVTLTANGGGVGGKCGMYLIDGSVRKLTPRECARLQGFPESFKLDVSDNVAYTTLGNSVDVGMVQLIIQELTNNESVMRALQGN